MLRLTTGHVARLLDVSERTVRILHARGVLPAERTLGGIRLFDSDAVERERVRRAASTITPQPLATGGNAR
jgi:excisionase family DNA binding protein